MSAFSVAKDVALQPHAFAHSCTHAHTICISHTSWCTHTLNFVVHVTQLICNTMAIHSQIDRPISTRSNSHLVEVGNGLVAGPRTTPIRPVVTLDWTAGTRVRVICFERLIQIPAERQRRGRPVNLIQRGNQHAHTFAFCHCFSLECDVSEILREHSSHRSPGHRVASQANVYDSAEEVLVPTCESASTIA